MTISLTSAPPIGKEPTLYEALKAEDTCDVKLAVDSFPEELKAIPKTFSDPDIRECTPTNKV